MRQRSFDNGYISPLGDVRLAMLDCRLRIVARCMLQCKQPANKERESEKHYRRVYPL